MIEFENSAVGRVVRRLRKEKGLSQEVFSGFAGIARSHLAMIENGTKKPKAIPHRKVGAILPEVI